MTNKFHDKEGGEIFAEQKLKEKYNQNFIVDKEAKEKYTSYPLKNVYTGVFTLEGDKSKKVSIWVSSKGELKDNYAQYLFNQTGENEVAKLIEASIEHVEVEVHLVGSQTEKKYTSKDTIKKYLEETPSYYDLKIELLKVENEEDSTQQIEQLLSVLYSHVDRFDIQVFSQNTSLFFYQYTPEKKKLSKEEISKKMLEEQEENEYQKEMFSN